MFLVVLFFYTKPEVKIITAENNEYYKGVYPKSCYLKFENKNFLIQNVYKYKYGILNEYWFLGSEGFAIEKLGFLENDYSIEQKPYKYLNSINEDEFLKFGNEIYKIDKKKGDTIISKINDNKIILFIKVKNSN